MERETLREQINALKSKETENNDRTLLEVGNEKDISKLEKLLHNLEAEWQEKYRNIQKEKSQIIGEL